MPKPISILLALGLIAAPILLTGCGDPAPTAGTPSSAAPAVRESPGGKPKPAAPAK